MLQQTVIMIMVHLPRQPSSWRRSRRGWTCWRRLSTSSPLFWAKTLLLWPTVGLCAPPSDWPWTYLALFNKSFSPNAFCNLSDLHLLLLWLAMDPSVKTTIEQRLVETGEKERLKEHLRLLIEVWLFPSDRGCITGIGWLSQAGGRS